MANTSTQKDYSHLSKRQLFNLMDKTEQKIKKIQNDRIAFKEKMDKELEKQNRNFNNKLDELTKLLQEINLAFDSKRANDCCFGHETPNLETQQAMRDIDNKETSLEVDDFSNYSNERKRALGVETNS
ncbi:hypothetical protein [Helicobacter cetorum]|uniref:Uncharacterized protein n=1 Tax=Helicobacter cetorum (strain ATCC BAA-429 / MIT 00-7128) TaxID=182217 RepID=I0EQ04_HELC0|nr:hypothetical protein [Helicobacter cetorum]AFI05023.1 hypothetical protein HCW_08938 [Helicobacter cetorum MIT 00-7128]